MLPPGTNNVLGQTKQGGGPDSASRPCVCHLRARVILLNLSKMFFCPKASSGFPLHFELIKSSQYPQTLAPLTHLSNLVLSRPPLCPVCCNHTHHGSLQTKTPASGHSHWLFCSLGQEVLCQILLPHTLLPHAPQNSFKRSQLI